jgi:hypothetical protein
MCLTNIWTEIVRSRAPAVVNLAGGVRAHDSGRPGRQNGFYSRSSKMVAIPPLTLGMWISAVPKDNSRFVLGPYRRTQ